MGGNDTHIVPVLPERARGTNSDLQIAGGAPSTGAVGTTCVSFLEGNKLAWKDHLYSRCSSKRAVGDQSGLPLRKYMSKLGRTI